MLNEKKTHKIAQLLQTKNDQPNINSLDFNSPAFALPAITCFTQDLQYGDTLEVRRILKRSTYLYVNFFNISLICKPIIIL